MNLAQFKKAYPKTSQFMDDQGLPLTVLEVSGAIDTNIICVKSRDSSALQNLNLPEDVAKEFKLSTDFAKIRPLCAMSSAQSDFLTTFSLGELYSSMRIGATTDELIKRQEFVPLDRAFAAELTMKLHRKLKAIKGRAPTLMMDYLGVKQTQAAAATHFMFELDHDADSEVVDLAKGIFGLDNMPRSLNGRALRVFLCASNTTGFLDGTYYALPDQEWELRPNCFSDVLAPDVRYVAINTVISSDRTTYAPVGTKEYAAKIGYNDGIVELGGQQMESVELILEIPFHEGPSDTNVVIGHSFENRFLNRASSRFESNIGPVDVTASAQTMNRAGITALYPNVVFEINGVKGGITAFPESLLNLRGSSVEWFLPLVGVPPYAHLCLVGSLSESQDAMICNTMHFKADSEWFVQYQLTGFGRKLKPLAAARVSDEWPKDASNVTCSVYSETMSVTEEEVKSLRIARKYKKHREDACKTDNFMTLDYVQGVTYRAACEKTKQLNVLCAFDNIGVNKIIVSSGATATLKKSSGVYTLTENGVVSTYKLSTISESDKSKLAAIASEIYLFGGVLPSTWQTDLGVSPEVLADLDAFKFEIKHNNGAKHWVFDEPINIKANTSVMNTVNAFSRNGFLNLDTMTEEDRILAKLHSAVCTSVTSKSITSILKQFWNDDYAVPLA